MESVARDIKALSIPINDDRVYKQFKKNLDKAIAEYDEIIQIYNVIMGLGEISVWMKWGARHGGLHVTAKIQMD